MIHREDLHSAFIESGEPLRSGRSTYCGGICSPAHILGVLLLVDEVARERGFRIARAATLERRHITHTNHRASFRES